jgi:hypothetical protein
LHFGGAALACGIVPCFVEPFGYVSVVR